MNYGSIYIQLTVIRLTEKRFEVGTSENQDTIFDNEGPDDYYHLGNDTEDVKALCKLLNELHEENQQLKILTKPVQDTIIEEFTITKEDLSNNQRITELTNYALTEFIKSKGYTLKEVNQFIKEEL